MPSSLICRFPTLTIRVDTLERQLQFEITSAVNGSMPVIRAFASLNNLGDSQDSFYAFIS